MNEQRIVVRILEIVKYRNSLLWWFLMNMAVEDTTGAEPADPAAELVPDVLALYRRVGEEMRSRLGRVAADYRLSPLHAHLLHVLESPSPMGAAAERLCLDASYLTGLTDRLEELGLVRRVPDSTDRRVKILEVTTAGRRVRAEIRDRMQHESALAERLDAGELRQLAGLLHKVLGAPGGE